MGYDLHITRRAFWADDDGPEIGLDEWKAYVASDSEIQPDSDNGPTDFLWAAHPHDAPPLWWDRGEIYTKNPDKITIRKLAAIAEQLSAVVQGDDGEVYREDGISVRQESSAPTPVRPGLLTRIASWFRHRRSVPEAHNAAPAFRVGQRVKNPWGEAGTVLSVDRNANGGLGSIHVCLDDGREQNLTYLASGLEIVDETDSA